MENIPIVGPIVGIISALVGVFLFNTIGMSARLDKPKQDGTLLSIQYSKGYLFLVGLVVLMFAYLVPHIIDMFLSKNNDHIFIASSLSLMGIFVLALFIGGGFYTRVTFDDTGFEKFDYRGSKRMKWADVNRVYFSGNWQAFVIKSPSSTIRVSRYLSGIGYYLKYLDQYVNPKALESIRVDIAEIISEVDT